MRIAVMGSGGLGAYVGARLAAAGAEVEFVARGTQLSAMRNNGLAIRSPLGDLRLPRVVVTATAKAGPIMYDTSTNIESSANAGRRCPAGTTAATLTWHALPEEVVGAVVPTLVSAILAACSQVPHLGGSADVRALDGPLSDAVLPQPFA